MYKKIITKIIIATTILSVSAIIQAKTVRFKNDSNEKIFVYFPLFTSVTSIDRWPAIESFNLSAGEHKDIYVKPYQYNSSIYIPNIEWIEDTNNSNEATKRAERVKDEFSYGSDEDWKKGFSIKVVAGNGYFFIPTTDKKIGTLIKEMAEEPETRPKDGFSFYRASQQDKPAITVTAGSNDLIYNEEDDGQ